jgi:hypothetical protein
MADPDLAAIRARAGAAVPVVEGVALADPLYRAVRAVAEAWVAWHEQHMDAPVDHLPHVRYAHLAVISLRGLLRHDEADRLQAENHGLRAEQAQAGRRWEQAREEASRLKAQVDEYEGAITWGTSCTSCARVLDAAIAGHQRAERAGAELGTAREQVDRLRKMLKRVEWTPGHLCPICEHPQPYGHTKRCALAALLGQGEEP